jgi:hypothetical protein
MDKKKWYDFLCAKDHELDNKRVLAFMGIAMSCVCTFKQYPYVYLGMWLCTAGASWLVQAVETFISAKYGKNEKVQNSTAQQG